MKTEEVTHASSQFSGEFEASKDMFEADFSDYNLAEKNLIDAIFSRTNLYQAHNVNFNRAYLDHLSINVDRLPCL